MKPPLVLLILFVLPLFAAAQSAQRDLKTLLQDAAYVFNRFEETTAGRDAEIDNWSVPASSKMLFKRELSGVAKNVSSEKPRLNALLGKNDVSSTDLFDVYSEVIAVASELFGQSSNYLNWGNDPAKGIELAQLGSKAEMLGADISVILRMKIKAQEAQLATCSNKPPPPASRQK